MQEIWNSASAEIATKGKSNKQWSGGKLVIDSRLVEKGDVFVALKGNYSDGHDHIAHAISQGASAAIVSRAPTNIDRSFPLLVVDDTREAINNLAYYKRQNSQAKFIAITGSVGKTSTKEILRIALSAHGKVFASRGNYNNFLGVPINLASMPDDIDFAIIEMGMDSKGELLPLTHLAKPHSVIITSIHPVHIGNFATIEDLALAKAEIMEGLETGGIIILNKDNDQYELLRQQSNKVEKKVLCSVGEGGDSELRSFALTNLGATVNANIKGREVEYSMSSFGKHLAENSVLALTAVSAFGLDIELSAQKLVEFLPLPGRGRITYRENFTLIDESYNASPIAVKAALKVLGAIKGGRKVAILADMRELGTRSEEYHIKLLDDIIENKINKVITFGPEMKKLFMRLPVDKQAKHFDRLENLSQEVKSFIDKDDIVLIKGSYGTKIHTLIPTLTEGH